MKDKPSITPNLQQFITHLLRRAGDQAAEVSRKHMEANCGLTAREWGILHLAQDKPQNQQEIADRLGIDRSAMVKLVDSLEKQGCIKRTMNPDDRRQHLLKVTPKGLTAYRAGLKALKAMNDELFARLTADEINTLQDILLKILDR